MDYFNYKNGELTAESVPISSIASEIGTPFYCYSSSSIEHQYNSFLKILADCNATVCYSVKANSNLSVIRTLAKLGAGADVVSEGELIRALKAGIPPHKIVFSGVGKTSAELALALEKNVLQINIESEPELLKLNEIARTMSIKSRVAVRINPDVNAESHDKINTGRREDKFGVDWTKADQVFSNIKNLKNVEPVGLAMHIGSQLTSIEPFRNSFLRLREVAKSLMASGHNIMRLDLGGGLGIPYAGTATPDFSEYGQLVNEILGELSCELIFEPGRLIVGNAGVLITKVIFIKAGDKKNFVIVDAAMNDLLRPSLYGARHEVVTVSQLTKGNPDGAHHPIDLVGPICETGDSFGSQLTLAPVNAEDLLAIRSAGAYGAVMSSTYNSRPLIPEVLVKGNEFKVIRERIKTDTLLSYEKMPHWLE